MLPQLLGVEQSLCTSTVINIEERNVKSNKLVSWRQSCRQSRTSGHLQVLFSIQRKDHELHPASAKVH